MSEREARTRTLRAVVDGETLEVRLAASGDVVVSNEQGETRSLALAEVGGVAPRSVRVERAPDIPAPQPSPGTWEEEDAPIRARVATLDGVTWVFLDGDVFEVQVDAAAGGAPRRRDRASQDALAAPMPATVSRILVETGQTVARGDTLLLLEAMKMEMPIKAPQAGRVAAIRCQPGDLVQPGVPLLDLEGS